MTPELWETPEGWQRLKPLIDATLEKPPGERARFMDKVCGGDAELRGALERVVNAHGDSTGPVDTPGIDFHRWMGENRPTFAEGDLVLERFRIVRLVGSGGMGEVYEAVDLELGRVALKTIRPDIAGNPAVLARFKKEVQLALKISGPHICRIHALHVPGNKPNGVRQTFLTMEYLDGVTLAEKIRESAPLPWREVKTIALEICEGLRVMHEAGIIHRDLKSRNVMLAKRNGVVCAVVMDFGLAREVASPTSETATEVSAVNTVEGTVEYMAPEQFEGKEVGPAADIYALGVVMYELATRKNPFPSSTTLQAAVQRGRRPAAPSSIQKGLPHRCDEVVCRCLEFDPKRRYGSARIVAEEIRDSWRAKLRRSWLRATAAILAAVALASGLMLVPAIHEQVQGILFSSREKHIAVLPFEVTGNDPQTQALGDGLMDSLTGKLSNLDAANQTLWVVPASEVRSRKVKDPSSALKEFGATIVVQGHFERNDRAARLKLTLIDPRKMREIGFADVESPASDLGALEDEAVTRLGRLMNISVGETLVQSGERPVTRAAYEDYLAGLGYFQRSDKPGNIDLAIAALQSAVKTDPTFALGFAHLAEAYTMKYRLESDPKSLQQAESYGRQAAELDDRVPATYVALGQIHELTGNHDLAIQEFQRSINLDPRDPDAIAGIANSYRNAGRNTEAENAYLKAASLRPNDWKGYNDLGNFYEEIGRPKDAIVQYQRALGLAPDNSWIYTNLGMTYMDFDDPPMLDNAEKALKKSIELNPTFVAFYDLGFLYAEKHEFAKSISANRAAVRLNERSYDAWYNLAAAYEWLKEDQQANFARRRAISILEDLVGRNQQDAQAQATLASLYAKIGEKAKAKDKIDISVALAPQNQYVCSQVADAYELLGERDKAISYLRQAITLGLNRGQLEEDPELQQLLASTKGRI